MLIKHCWRVTIVIDYCEETLSFMICGKVSRMETTSNCKGTMDCIKVPMAQLMVCTINCGPNSREYFWKESKYI